MNYRYDESRILTNKDELYTDVIKNRFLKQINHFETQTLVYPTVEQIQQLKIVPYIWKSNDKLWKLSDTYYGDSNYWWVISFFNKKPTDMHMELGEVINIPLPLDRILFYLKG